jgi:translation initiation factor 2 subunit 3
MVDISKQPTLNIGTVGPVNSGKSKTLYALTGTNTSKFKDEKVRNITIKLGYTNCKIYKCPVHRCYSSTDSDSPSPVCPRCSSEMVLTRHVSFVDCPGHELLTTTMTTGASAIDSALFLIAANEPFPQSQSVEHLLTLESLGVSSVIILLNKIDLITEEKGKELKQSIDNFFRGTCAENAPVIPMSAQQKINIDILCEYLITKIPEPITNTSNPVMEVLRSFDVNKPGDLAKDIKGGVLGGSVKSGKFTVGDTIEIRPGMVSRNKETKKQSITPFITTITSLYTEENELNEAYSGGLVGVGTTLDPSICSGNKMVGQVIGLVGSMPPVWNKFYLKYKLLQKADKPVVNEELLISCGSSITRSVVTSIDSKKKELHISLELPVCCDESKRVILSRKINGHWKLIGNGVVSGGKKILE